MESAKVISHRSGPYTPPPEDWDEADCLCQGKIPDGKAIEYANRVFRERDKKWVWKPWLRIHTDCPIHGAKPLPASNKD